MPAALRIRIVATAGPGRTFGDLRDVRVGLQVRQEVVELVRGDVPRAEWTIDATLDDKGIPRGPAIHGGRGERFVYLVWLAGAQRFRRAKLRLDGLDPKLLARAAAGRTLVGELSLKDAKGEPVCASVRPPAMRWSVD